LMVLGDEQGQQAFAIQLVQLGKVCVHA